MNIEDIPKIYTALAEWGSCLIFEIILFTVFYVGLFAVLYFLVRRYFADADRRDVTWQEAAASVLMAVAAFLISNISYVYPNTPFGSSLPGNIYLRVLIPRNGQKAI